MSVICYGLDYFVHSHSLVCLQPAFTFIAILLLFVHTLYVLRLALLKSICSLGSNFYLKLNRI